MDHNTNRRRGKTLVTAALIAAALTVGQLAEFPATGVSGDEQRNQFISALEGIGDSIDASENGVLVSALAAAAAPIPAAAQQPRVPVEVDVDVDGLGDESQDPDLSF
jgi:hypothetical protein